MIQRSGRPQQRLDHHAPNAPASAVILSRALYRELWNDQLSWVHVAVDGDLAGVQQRGANARREVSATCPNEREPDEYFASQARRAFQFVYIMEAILFLIVIVAIG